MKINQSMELWRFRWSHLLKFDTIFVKIFFLLIRNLRKKQTNTKKNEKEKKLQYSILCAQSKHYSQFNGSLFCCRDIEKIRDGIAEKVSQFLWLIMGFVICVTLSFIYGWELSLVVISYVPIVMITNTIIGKVCQIFNMYRESYRANKKNRLAIHVKVLEVRIIWLSITNLETNWIFLDTQKYLLVQRK